MTTVVSMTKPAATFSVSVRANCGCGWRAGGADVHAIFDQAKEHAALQMRPTLTESAHTVEMFVLIRPGE